MSSSAIVSTAIVLGTGLAAIVDLRTRKVPNVVTASLASTGVLVSFAGIGHVGFVASLLGLGLGVALMLPGHLFGATGAGDVKLFAAVGAFLGPAGILSAFLYTAIAGGVLAVVIAIRRGCARRTIGGAARFVASCAANRGAVEHLSVNNRFAYAPAIAIGAAVAALAR